MLDNIVTDGMRVAAEVKRRMDEAQKELDKGGVTRGTEDDDDEEEHDAGGDLLEGAEADAGVGVAGASRSRSASVKSEGQTGDLLLDESQIEGRRDKGKGKEADQRGRDSEEVEKSTVFER